MRQLFITLFTAGCEPEVITLDYKEAIVVHYLVPDGSLILRLSDEGMVLTRSINGKRLITQIK